jgi:hypothetical protein
MKLKHTLLLTSLLELFLLCAMADSQTLADGSVPRTTAGSGQTRVATDAPDRRLIVNISADSWRGKFVTYMSGENFVIVVPQATTSAVNWNLTGRGLGGAQVEQRGEDVVVLLRVGAAAEPAVRQRGNELDVVLAARSTTAVIAGVVGSGTTNSPTSLTTASASVTTSTNNSDTGQPTPASPSSTSGGVGSQGPIGATLLQLLQQNTTADALNLDLSVPESPAFTVLNLTPQTVARPATPQEFATSVLNGLDQNGNFQNGIAIDTAPYMLFNGENVKIRDYMQQPLTRILARTQLSFAVTKGASKDDLNTRLAMGLNVSLWDRGDPRIYRPGTEGDVLDCFVKTLDSTIPIPPSVDPNNQSEVQTFVASEQARLKPLADKCRVEGQKARWNRSALTVAYAPSWLSKTGNSSDFKWNGGAFWTSFAYGFEEVQSLRKIAQLILNARYRTREQVADENNPGKFLTQNTFFFGGRFRAGSPQFAFNIEDALLRTKTLGVGNKFDTSNRFSVGAELRLNDSLYFVISAGGNSGRSDGKSKGFVMTSFKYGFNKKAQLDPLPR